MTEKVAVKDKKLWSRKWATQGMQVIHVDNLKVVDGRNIEDSVMRIEKVIWRTFYPPQEDEKVKPEPRTYIDGIECHWFSSDMKFQKGLFHTNELIPYEIVKEKKVQQWFERIRDEHE